MSKLSQTITQISNILDQLSKSVTSHHSNQDLNNSIDSAKRNLKDIQQKLNDPNFYIGIVGGFSSGKTTFINAFIEGETLASDINQGTTCVNTYVLHGDQEKIVIKYKDGKIKTWPSTGIIASLLKYFWKKDLPIEHFIKAKTSNESECSKIKEVQFYTPSSGLKSNIVFVDTPGLGSTNPRHTELAKNTAQKKCDALLVLTSLHQPLSAELLAFIKNITNDDPYNCIFIGTFKDQIANEELERQKSFFKKKLNTVFGKNYNHQIFFVSAYQALQGLTQPIYKNYLNEFRKFKEQLLAFLEPQKTQITQQRITDLIIDTINSLNEGFTVQKNNFCNEIHALEQSLIPTKALITKYSCEENLNEFKNSKIKLKQDTLSQLERQFTLLDYAIKRNIYNCHKAKELNTFLKSGLVNLIHQSEAQMNTIAITSFNQQLNELSIATFNQSKKEINNFYNNIKQQQKFLKVNFNFEYNQTSISFANAVSNKAIHISSAFNNEDHQEAGGGLLLGLIIGTIILPGIGTAIGAILGLAAGGCCDLDKRKTKAYQLISQEIAYEQDFILSNTQTNINQSFKLADNLLKENLEKIKFNLMAVIKDLNQKKQSQIDKIKKSEQELVSFEQQLTTIIDQVNSNTREF